MIDIDKLKEVADKNGIAYSRSISENGLYARLKKNGLLDQLGESRINESENEYTQQEVEEKFTKEAPDVKRRTDELSRYYRLAQSELDVKKIDKERLILRKEVEESGDESALKRLLQWERSRKFLKDTDPDIYILNELEMKECTKECEQVHRISASGFFGKLGGVFKFYTYFDEAKQTEIYVLYVPQTITGDQQISAQLAQKMKRGFMPDKNDYAEDKVLYHRRPLAEKQFNKYFREIEG